MTTIPSPEHKMEGRDQSRPSVVSLHCGRSLRYDQRAIFLFADCYNLLYTVFL